MALLANALGFMVIGFVEIEMVHELALTATIGVSVMIITNKMLLPILMSYLHIKDPAKELKGMPGRKLSEGTFAIQAHDPKSTTFYKDIMVKPLP